MKNIYLIVGESGSGKSTIVDILEREHGLKSIQSYTTRPKRYDEETGHTFVTDEEFDRLENIVAYTEFSGHRYCATQEQVDNADLYIVDVDGVNSLRERYNGKKGIFTIYISCSLIERMHRLEERDGFDKALERIKHDIMAFRGVNELADRYFGNTCVDAEKVAGFIWEYIRECENG